MTPHIRGSSVQQLCDRRCNSSCNAFKGAGGMSSHVLCGLIPCSYDTLLQTYSCKIPTNENYYPSLSPVLRRFGAINGRSGTGDIDASILMLGPAST